MSDSLFFANRSVKLSLPLVMGVINLTPDSFYGRSRFLTEDAAVKAAGSMIDAGAAIIDVGGYSTRPGSCFVTEGVEMERVIPILKLLRREFPDAIISVDTFRSAVAGRAVLDCGADMINDISGGTYDTEMGRLAGRLSVPFVLMHNRGNPFNIHGDKMYDDVTESLLDWFGKRIDELRGVGVSDIIIDPGFGFSKSPHQSFELLRRLQEFCRFGLPVMAGLSRKSMIWKSLSLSPEEALNGTSALNMAALIKGAGILRVHDVKEACEVVRLFHKMGGVGWSV